MHARPFWLFPVSQFKLFYGTVPVLYCYYDSSDTSMVIWLALAEMAYVTYLPTYMNFINFKDRD